VYAKTGTTDDAADAWFVGCARAPQYVCIATWMGYEDHRSMRDIGGQRGLVYGGTVPARIFARTFEILREIQAARRAGPTSSPSPAAPVLPAAPAVPARQVPVPLPSPSPVPSAPAAPVPSPSPPAPVESTVPPSLLPPVAGASPPA
jgi:membrane peptidoglycan carboxypeptidase